MSNVECLRVGSLQASPSATTRQVAQSFFYKIDRSTQKLTTGRIHYFDIRYSLFDIRFFKVSFWIRLATFQIVGWVEIRATIVGFRSSTQPTEIVSRAQFDTQIETQPNYFDRISLIHYFVDRPETFYIQGLNCG